MTAAVKELILLEVTLSLFFPKFSSSKIQLLPIKQDKHSHHPYLQSSVPTSSLNLRKYLFTAVIYVVLIICHPEEFARRKVPVISKRSRSNNRPDILPATSSVTMRTSGSHFRSANDVPRPWIFFEACHQGKCNFYSGRCTRPVEALLRDESRGQATRPRSRSTNENSSGEDFKRGGNGVRERDERGMNGWARNGPFVVGGSVNNDGAAWNRTSSSVEREREGMCHLLHPRLQTLTYPALPRRRNGRCKRA